MFDSQSENKVDNHQLMRARVVRSAFDAGQDDEEEYNTSAAFSPIPLRFSGSSSTSGIGGISSPIQATEKPDLTLDRANLLEFCDKAIAFKLTYNDRYRYKVEGGTCASGELMKFLTNLFLLVNKKTLKELLETFPQLTEQLQLSLMHVLKEFSEMEIKKCSENYPELPVEHFKQQELSDHYDNLDKFKEFLEPQVYGTKKYMMKFRYLFPLATSSVPLPDELHDRKIKPFMDQVEAIFSKAFSKDRRPRNYLEYEEDSFQLKTLLPPGQSRTNNSFNRK